jgi:hypothetical protein
MKISAVHAAEIFLFKASAWTKIETPPSFLYNK